MNNVKMRSVALAATVRLLAIAPGAWGQDGGGTWTEAFVGVSTK
jgi:hypothetical protein